MSQQKDCGELEKFSNMSKKIASTTNPNFNKFKPEKSKSPSKKKNNTIRHLVNGDTTFIFSNSTGLKMQKGCDSKDITVSSHIPYAVERCFIYDIYGDRESILVWSIYSSEADTIRSGMKDIQSDKYLSVHLPHYVRVYCVKAFKEFLQIQSSNVPLVNLYQYIGFIPEKFDYVHSGGIISAVKNNNSHSELLSGSKTLAYYGYKSEEIFKALDNLIQLTPIISVMISFNLLSLTCSKYRQVKPQFIFQIYGETGTFKSTISNHIFGIFEEFYNNAPINIKVASLPSIHNLQLQFRDCVMLNDDGAPSPDGNNEICKKVESISRSVGDNTGRIVMKGVDKIHATKPSCLNAVTAEFQPLRDLSDMSRAVMYELKRGEIDISKLTKVQSQKHEYIRFITDYIAWICDLKDNYMEDLEKLFYKGRSEYDKFNKIHARLPENFGWIYAGFHMFLRFVTKKYGISDKKIKQWNEIFETAIYECISLQKSEMKTVDDVKLFISTVKKMLVSKQLNITSIYKIDNNKKKADNNSQTIGYIDDEFVYLDMSLAYTKTNIYLRQTGEGYALPEKALQSRMVERGIIILTEKGRHTTKITINGHRISLLKCKLNTFFDKN